MLLKIRFTVNLNTNSLLFEILTWIYTHFVPFYTLFGTNAPQQCMQGLHERPVVATTIFKHLNIYKYLYYNRMLRLVSLCLFFSTLLNFMLQQTDFRCKRYFNCFMKVLRNSPSFRLLYFTSSLFLVSLAVLIPNFLALLCVIASALAAASFYQLLNSFDTLLQCGWKIL